MAKGIKIGFPTREAARTYARAYGGKVRRETYNGFPWVVLL